MTTDDKQEVRQMLEDVIRGYSENITGRLNLISAHLVRVEGNTQRTEAHAEKTNGRVTKAEKDIQELKEINLTHVVNCPNTAEINEFKKKEFGRTMTIKFALGLIGVSSTIIGIALGIAKLIA